MDVGISLWLKLEAEIHPEFGGNKYRKLKYNLKNFDPSRHEAIVSFGGLHSNHIHALAAVTKVLEIPCIGIIRGEEQNNSPTLQFATQRGMQLRYVSRAKYRDKESLLKELELDNGYLVIPEGGTNDYAINGCAEIVDEIKAQFTTFPDHIAVPFGTGGTSLGILKGMKEKSKLMIFPALKGEWIEKELTNLWPDHPDNYKLFQDYHFGGYGKFNDKLIEFIYEFHQLTGIPLDPIYTAKMMYGIVDLIKSGYFKKGEQLLVVHTGGIQGNLGFNQRFGTNLPTNW